MNLYRTRKVYLIIIVVLSISTGFITGYMVGLKHKEVNSEQKKMSTHMPEGFKTDKTVPLETPTVQDIKTQNQGGSLTQESYKNGQSLEKSEDVIKIVQEEKRSEVHGSGDERSRQKPRKGIYTVQVGAFKDKKEAEELKIKLEKKGYNIYITKEDKHRRGAGLFKVKVGDFDTKKEAEIFSVKLIKTEGLQAFVVKK